MPLRSRTRTRMSVVALFSALIAVAGCAGTIGGTASIDGSALLSSAFSATPTAGTTAATSAATGSTVKLPTSMSFNLPAPPSPTLATTTATPSPTTSSTDSSPTRATTAKTSTTPANGVDVDAIVVKLATNPLYADPAATKAADSAALAALGKQITTARAGGFPVTVVLIGHEVDDLTTITDAIAKRTDETSIAVSTSHFAVSSKDFTDDQLTKAEDAASSAGTPVEAASKLLTALQAQRTTTTTSKTATKTTSKATGTSGAGGVVAWDRFQLPDGSIACLIDSDTVRCDVAKHTYTPPKNPNPDCQGDWGAAVEMTGSKAPSFICISDTVADPGLPKLANGGTTQVGNIMCFSDPPAITCLSLESAHGFVLQPNLYQFY